MIHLRYFRYGLGVITFVAFVALLGLRWHKGFWTNEIVRQIYGWILILLAAWWVIIFVLGLLEVAARILATADYEEVSECESGSPSGDN